MVRTRSNLESLRNAGIACVAGAFITAIGGAASQIAVATTEVSDEAWTYPWPSETFVALSLLWGLAHALIFIGLLGLRRSGLAGPTRAAAVGLTLALTGTALLLVGNSPRSRCGTRASTTPAPRSWARCSVLARSSRRSD